MERDAAPAIADGNCNQTPQSEKRTPRRRLVQSTLFPHRPKRSDHGKKEEVEEENDGEEGEQEDEECCGSQKKKGNGRKRKGRPSKTTTPRKVSNNCKEALGSGTESNYSLAVHSRGSPQQLKEKQHGEASPCKYQTPRKLKHTKKNLLHSHFDAAQDVEEQGDCAKEPVFDLRLEAKLAAEENARIFTGKQTHPFFSLWKVGKKSQGSSVGNELENKYSSAMPEDEGTVCHPVHVFETWQDDYVSLDWSNWVFCDEKSHKSTSSENKCSSAFENSIEPLGFENCPAISSLVGVSFHQNKVHLSHSPNLVEHADQISPISSADEQASHHIVKDLKLHQKYLAWNDEQQQEGFLPERLTSHYCGCNDQMESGLWTIKYQPEIASKVCGNNESVQFLNEWLSSWNERYSGVHKNSKGLHNNTIQDIDYDLNENGSDTESMDGNSFNNVLLITGPVGSGKSAAIYACAKEQGFEVIEVNASDWRNGALLKQKFGAGLESLGLDKWSVAGANSRRKHATDSLQAHLGNSSVIELDDKLVELIPEKKLVPDDNVVKNNINGCQGAGKTLILFEDVDIIFEEDRGFITTIQQIAERAKRPMILTSNSNDPVLPDQLNRLKVCFASPTPEELFSLLHMVCATEKANIQCHLLEQLIGHCQGDIRKSLLFLQFWCLGKSDNNHDRNLQSPCGPLPFDLDLGHCALPNLFPWRFPCPLSELVEKEITKALSEVKENNSLLETVEEDELSDKGTQDALMMDIRQKKEVMLNMYCSVQEGNEFSTQFDSVADMYNSSCSPVAFTRTTARRRTSTVLSSASGDELCNDGSLFDLNLLPGETNDEAFPDSHSKLLGGGRAVYDCPVTSIDLLHHSETGILQEDLRNCSQREDNKHLYDACTSVDISCVPESSFVPETKISDGVELPSKTVSCGHFPTIKDGPSCAMSIQSLQIVDAVNVDKTALEPVIYSEIALGSTYHVDTELTQVDEEVGDSHNEHASVIRGYQVMDECSRADFNKASISGEHPRCSFLSSISGENSSRCSTLTGSVQETWKSLHNRHKDLKLDVTSEHRNAAEIVKLASGMTDLISKADVLLSCCPSTDCLESSMVSYVELDAFHCYDEQLKMISTIMEHGFCYFAKESAAKEPNLSSKNEVNLDQEILASMPAASDMGASIQKCARRGSDIQSPSTNISLKRETEMHLNNMIQNLVPSKSYLAFKGAAFHEYMTYLGQISKLEASRVSISVDNIKHRRRRTRASRHYLITGPLALLPEDVSFLVQSSSYGKAQLGTTKANYR